MQFATAQSDIVNFFTQLKTFSAEFYQVVEQDGKVVQRSAGDVLLKKPMKFRWDYKKPEKMQLLSDGKKFYHYDIGLAQVTVKPVTEVADSTLVTLLNDENQLDRIFTVTSFAAPAVKRLFPAQADQWLAHADFFYSLKPRANKRTESTPTLVILGLTSQRQLGVFHAEDNYGKNTFLFKNIKQNKNIPNKKFRFKAPKGVDVLGK